MRPPMMPPAIAPARFLGEEEELADTVALLVGTLMAEVVNVPLAYVRHSVASPVMILNVPFVIPMVVRPRVFQAEVRKLNNA